VKNRQLIVQSVIGDQVDRYRPHPTQLRLPCGTVEEFKYWSDAVDSLATRPADALGLYLVSQDGITLDTFCVHDV
jgi:hypothetical protein